jgi:hypothetical protein
MERSEAKRNPSLLGQEIARSKDRLQTLTTNLGRMDSHEHFEKGVDVLNGLIGGGGLDALRDKITEYRRFERRIGEINVALRNAGVSE